MVAVKVRRAFKYKSLSPYDRNIVNEIGFNCESWFRWPMLQRNAIIKKAKTDTNIPLIKLCLKCNDDNQICHTTSNASHVHIKSTIYRHVFVYKGNKCSSCWFCDKINRLKWIVYFVMMLISTCRKKANREERKNSIHLLKILLDNRIKML